MSSEPYRSDIGVAFQASVRSPEWKAALIVYEKYKRKHDLEHADLMRVKNHVVSFSENRKAQNKAANKDLLTQEASAEIKRLIAKKREHGQDLHDSGSEP